MRLVIDTNVLVSALINRSGVPAHLLERIVAIPDHELLHDHRILVEYREVLMRAEFGFDRRAIDELLTAMEAMGLSIPSVPLRVRLPDPGDTPFLEVAVAGRAHAIVTGNARHFAPVTGTHEIPVLTPREMLERMRNDRTTGSQ